MVAHGGILLRRHLPQRGCAERIEIELVQDEDPNSIQSSASLACKNRRGELCRRSRHYAVTEARLIVSQPELLKVEEWADGADLFVNVADQPVTLLEPVLGNQTLQCRLKFS